MVFFGLGLMRLLRGWNQTGQKFAGEPDIVTTLLLPNPTLLWALVWATYSWVAWELLNDMDMLPTMLSGSVVTGVVTSAVSFKLVFTKQDAPELVVGLARFFADLFDGPSLVTQARSVFMGISLTALYPAYLLFFKPTRLSKERGKCLRSGINIILLTMLQLCKGCTIYTHCLLSRNHERLTSRCSCCSMGYIFSFADLTSVLSK